MKIELEQRGKYLLIQPQGRLDVSWADYFSDTLLLQIRKGRHHLVIDASEMVFLSSAGIRALLQVHKALNAVRGRLWIVNPTAFVAHTLSTSGFTMWLEEGVPDDMPSAGSGNGADNGNGAGIRQFVLNEQAALTVSAPAGWHPWQAVGKNAATTLTFTQDSFAVGIGSAAGRSDDARDHYGEFLAVAGNVVFQPPDEQSPPDYLIAEKQFVPRMQCIQVLNCQGDMKHLIRFAPTEEMAFYTLSALLGAVLAHTGGRSAGFVMLGEIEGLVGTALIRSPGRIRDEMGISFPEIRDWLTFCGERCFSHQQALLAGVVSEKSGPFVPALPSRPDTAAHMHAAVFPYQPLPNGKIPLAATVQKFMHGPPPLAVMHLADDVRPVVGLGESALIRGGCWFSPLHNPEVLS